MVKPIMRETAQVKKEVEKTKAAKAKVTKTAKKVESKTKTAKEVADEAEQKLLAISPKTKECVAYYRVEMQCSGQEEGRNTPFCLC